MSHRSNSDISKLDTTRAMEMVRAVGFCKDENDHLLKRRFRRLHLYNLYCKHARLVDLDKRIAQLEKRVWDATHLKPGQPLPNVPEVAVGIDDLIMEIDQALRDFDTASLQFQRSMNAPKPQTYYLQELKKVVYDHKYWEYYNQYDSEDGWSECTFHIATTKELIHKCIDRIGFLKMLFVKDPEQQQTEMLIYSEDRVRVFEEVFIIFLFCLLVFIPMFILSYLKTKVWKLILVLLCVIASAFVASFLTNAKHKTSLAVVAAYTAILVVFLSNNQGS